MSIAENKKFIMTIDRSVEKYYNIYSFTAFIASRRSSSPGAAVAIPIDIYFFTLRRG